MYVRDDWSFQGLSRMELKQFVFIYWLNVWTAQDLISNMTKPSTKSEACHVLAILQWAMMRTAGKNVRTI